MTRSQDTDQLSALTGLGRAYRRAALASPELYGLMFGPPAAGFEPDPADDAAARATYQPCGASPTAWLADPNETNGHGRRRSSVLAALLGRVLARGRADPWSSPSDSR